MRIAKSIFAGVLVTPLLVVFLLLTSVTFQLLNSSYLLPSFERNHVYEKVPQLLSQSLPNDPNLPDQERGDYASIAAALKPEVTKKVIETNLSQVLDYIHGTSNDIAITISLKEMGVPDAKDIQWSLSQTPPAESNAQITVMHGLWNKLVIAWVVLILIIGFLLYLGGRTVLLIEGILITILSLIAKIFLLVLAGSLPSQPEPSQKLLGFFAATLFAEITTVWLIIGLIILGVWFFLRKQLRA